MESGKKDGSMWQIGGKVDSSTAQGDKGIPPGMPSSKEPGAVKGVVESITKGDKGIPPMGGAGVSKPAPRD